MFKYVKEQVNKNREGKYYNDIISANTTKKTVEKPNLLTDLFIRVFEYVNKEIKEGYWSYDQMVL